MNWLLIIWFALVQSLAPAPVIAHPPLAITITEPGVVRIGDDQLRAAGWTSIPRDRVVVTRDGRTIGLADDSTGFAFIGQPNTSQWSAAAVYVIGVQTTAAPRSPLAPDSGWPVQWERDELYERHHQTTRGDSWWAGELRGAATVQGRLVVPTGHDQPIRLILVMQGTSRTTHAVRVSVDGIVQTTLRWNDPQVGPRQQEHEIVLPPRAAGPMVVDLVSTGTSTVLVDSMRLPDVAVPVRTLPAPILRPVRPVDVPGVPPDILIIVHSTLQAALPPLVAAHQAAGRRVVITDVQDIYDRYTGGEVAPEAIRSYLRAVRPGAVLLVGAGSTALREPREQRPALIPPYLVVDVQDGETACDTCYVRWNAGPAIAQYLPDVPIGRLPVGNLVEATTVVRKTVSALATGRPAGPWQTRAIILADNDRTADGTVDPAGPFTRTADISNAALPEGITATRLYYAPDRTVSLPPYEPSTARIRCLLFRAIDGGRTADQACPAVDRTQSGIALWVYVGHGSPWQWATTEPTDPTPYLWYLYDADARRNGERLPILLSMTCLSGDVANPLLQANDERLLLHAEGGIAASLSSAGEGVNTGHARLVRGVLEGLTARVGIRTLGSAHLAGLAGLAGGNQDLAFSFAILGDPFVQLPFVPVQTLRLPLVLR